MTDNTGSAGGWILALYGLVGIVAVIAWRTHQGQATPLGAAERAAAPSLEAAPLSGNVDLPAKNPGASSRSIAAIVEDASRALALADESVNGLLIKSPPSPDAEVRRRQQQVQLGVGASLGGLRPFNEHNPWNQRIDDAPVDPHSQAILRSIGLEQPLHPDFGSGEWEGARIGIPYVVVSSLQPRVPVSFVEYPEESDPGPYPLPPGAPIESAPHVDADRHVLVLDRDNWKLYELFHAFETAEGWRANGGAIWDLNSNTGRTPGWTSADAAGLPIFPGLVRYDEVTAGEIRHALRFTVSETRKAYVPPASHWASRNSSPLLPPMGMRVRLRRDFDVTKFPRDVQVILRCLQQYGMILADNGSDWFLSGAPDERWDNDALHELKQVRGSDFEVIRMDGLVAE